MTGTHPALPLLVAVTVEPERVTFTTREPDAPFTRRRTLPRLVYVDRLPQLRGPDVLAVKRDPRDPEPLAFTLSGAQAVNLREPLTLTVWAGEPHRSPVLVRYQAQPYTPEGQAALTALGFAGPYPAPEGVSLGGYAHGTALTEHEALTLAGLPEFPELWLICPSESGGAPFALLWGDAATNEQLERSSNWATVTTAALQAEGRARGSA